MIPIALLFFFFSSRRRHTRFDCDWSSDVCSSDLNLNLSQRRAQSVMDYLVSKGIEAHRLRAKGFGESRSEERRVGKECRSRWAPERKKKKVVAHNIISTVAQLQPSSPSILLTHLA